MTDRLTPSRPDDALVGQVLDDRYNVEAVLGRGAVGAVYRATDLHSGKPVALKQWRRADAGDEQVRGRFAREAAALDTLDHPGIVKVFGHGYAQGVPYVALEYLDGQTLESLIDGKPMQPAVAFDVARKALSAIAYAHARDVVHRDLKPENIFVQRDASGELQVKILDYGLAKFMQPEKDPTKGVALTMTGMVMGTPLYMPPEQAAGSSVDLPVDVYAFGCVLFEMLSGRPPYLGETNLELLSAHLRAPVPRLADVLPDVQVHEALQAIFDKALAKKQTERYPNAGALLAAIEALPQPVLMPRASRPASSEAIARLAAQEGIATEPGERRAPSGRGASAGVLTALGVTAALALLAYVLLR